MSGLSEILFLLEDLFPGNESLGSVRAHARVWRDSKRRAREENMSILTATWKSSLTQFGILTLIGFIKTV